MTTRHIEALGAIAFGMVVAALDARRTEPKEMSRLLGEWLFKDGCTVEPRFAGTWSEIIKPCQCATGE